MISRTVLEHDFDSADERRRIRELVHGDIHESDQNGVTPLHRAVELRSPAAVSALIEFGADVNCRGGRNGGTALHRAVTVSGNSVIAGRENERRRIIEILIKAGADPTIPNLLGKSALDCATDSETRRMLL